MTLSRESRPAWSAQLAVPKGNVLAGTDWVSRTSNHQRRDMEGVADGCTK